MSVTAVVIEIPGEIGWTSRKESIASLNGTRITNSTTPSIMPATISYSNQEKRNHHFQKVYEMALSRLTARECMPKYSLLEETKMQKMQAARNPK